MAISIIRTITVKPQINMRVSMGYFTSLSAYLINLLANCVEVSDTGPKGKECDGTESPPLVPLYYV